MSDLEHNLRLLLERWRIAAIRQYEDSSDGGKGASCQLDECIEDIETLLLPAPEPCDHNEMVSNEGGPGYPYYAWKCAKCGHVYGSSNNEEAS